MRKQKEKISLSRINNYTLDNFKLYYELQDKE